MPETITPKLGLTKPEVGGSTNNWGNLLNGNFDILDLKTVRNTAQWTMTLGDDIPTSTTGPFIITRFNNAGLPAGDAVTINRQTGEFSVTEHMNAAKDVIVGGKVTAIGGSSKITGTVIESNRGAFIGLSNIVIPPAAYNTANFTYVADHVSRISNSAAIYSSFNMYHDGTVFKNYAAGFSSNLIYTVSNGTLSLHTTSASVAAGVTPAPLPVITFSPTGVEVPGTFSVGTLSAGSVNMVGAITTTGTITGGSIVSTGNISANPTTGVINSYNASITNDANVKNLIASAEITTPKITVTGAFAADSGIVLTSKLLKASVPNADLINTGPLSKVLMVENLVSAHAFMSFNCNGFGVNFGLANDGHMYFGGVGHGTSIYKLWSVRDFNSIPVTTIRLAFAGDSAIPSNAGATEPFAGAVVTGIWNVGVGGNTLAARYRYLQNFTTNWFTVGYA